MKLGVAAPVFSCNRSETGKQYLHLSCSSSERQLRLLRDRASGVERMNTTSGSLLERLRQPAEQVADWERFVQLYTPLLYYWARQLGLDAANAADLVQEVFTLLVQKLPDFVYDRDKSFRSWLRTVTHNKWRETKRKRALPNASAHEADLADLVSPDTTDAFEEDEYRRRLVGRALDLMQAEFQPATWKACWECVVVGRVPTEVAAELGITVNAVYLAKSRVLRRLHQELNGLLD